MIVNDGTCPRCKQLIQVQRATSFGAGADGSPMLSASGPGVRGFCLVSCPLNGWSGVASDTAVVSVWTSAEPDPPPLT